MDQHEVSDNVSDAADERPLWVPPLPPEPEPWSVRMILERFGFLIAVLGVGLVFCLIYLNADWLLREPSSRRVDEASSSTTATPTVSAASAGAMLTVFSSPVGARVFIDGFFIGETPLVGHSLEKGTRIVSVRKEAFATRDTVITIEDEQATLVFTLQEDEDALFGEQETADAADLVEETEAEPAPIETPPAPPVATRETTQAEREAEPQPSPATTATAKEEDPPAEEMEEAIPPEPEAPATGALQVTSQPSGATVFVSGKEVGVTPVLVSEVEAGIHPVSMRMEGFDTFNTAVTIKPDERTSVNGSLQEALASLRILAKPWGAIYIDGEQHKKESTVWYTARLKPGPHRIRIEHPALGKWEQTITVSATDNEPIIVDFNSGGQQ